jgi:DNA-binding transcriptional regulator GbsR (MarR family)
MNKRLEDEANKRMADIVSSIEDKDKKMDKLKKLKDDLTEILELGDLSDEEALHKINPNNQIL